MKKEAWLCIPSADLIRDAGLGPANLHVFVINIIGAYGNYYSAFLFFF